MTEIDKGSEAFEIIFNQLQQNDMSGTNWSKVIDAIAWSEALLAEARLQAETLDSPILDQTVISIQKHFGLQEQPTQN